MPRKSNPDSPREWIYGARSALRVAKLAGKPGTRWEDFCFHCRQAAEKSIKAVYVARQLRFAYVHDIEFLLSGLAKKGISIPDEIFASTFVTRYASQTRCPGNYERVTKADHARAVDSAQLVVSWASKEIRK